jgi:hypothetical protein
MWGIPSFSCCVSRQRQCSAATDRGEVRVDRVFNQTYVVC